jgi:hypothetical protein
MGSAWSHGLVLIVPGGAIRVGDGRRHALPPVESDSRQALEHESKASFAARLFTQAPGGGNTFPSPPPENGNLISRWQLHRV